MLATIRSRQARTNPAEHTIGQARRTNFPCAGIARYGCLEIVRAVVDICGESATHCGIPRASATHEPGAVE
jgi:hypothetical protein